MDRRTFLKGTLLTTGVLVGFSHLTLAEEKRRGGAKDAAAGGAVLVDPKDPAAKAVNYVHNAKEIKDKTLTGDRSGVKFKDQKCKGCAFYLKDKETKVGGKPAAPCQMPFAAGKVVAAEGWCSTWAKKS